MKNLLLTIALAAGVCAASFAVFYAMNDKPAVRRAASEGNTMEWLRAEFRLSDAEFAAVRKLHQDFSAVCAQHCIEIMEARRSGAEAPEVARLEAICVEAMIGHFRAVAALMPAGEGERYLAVVLPRIYSHDHTGSPTIGVRH